MAHTCTHDGCGRSFLFDSALADHAERVHTFGDVRDLVSKALRERLRVLDPTGVLARPWMYIVEMSDSWVVFEVEGDNAPASLYQADYSISEGNVVTIGEPFEVVRRTVFEPVTPEA